MQQKSSCVPSEEREGPLHVSAGLNVVGLSPTLHSYPTHWTVMPASSVSVPPKLPPAQLVERRARGKQQ
jgi:hypothetical protein